jgi:hypothetical protein
MQQQLALIEFDGTRRSEKRLSFLGEKTTTISIATQIFVVPQEGTLI